MSPEQKLFTRLALPGGVLLGLLAGAAIKYGCIDEQILRAPILINTPPPRAPLPLPGPVDPSTVGRPTHVTEHRTVRSTQPIVAHIHNESTLGLPVTNLLSVQDPGFVELFSLPAERDGGFKWAQPGQEGIFFPTGARLYRTDGGWLAVPR